MIQINLLPHRRARRVADLRANAGLLVLGLILLFGGIGFVDASVDQEAARSEASVRQLRASIEAFKPQQRQVASFKKTKKDLQVKLDVIEGLGSARTGPLRLLEEVSSRTPDRLWLTKLTTKGRKVVLSGESLDTGIVADFLRSLNESGFFENVDLESTSRGNAVRGVKLVAFTVTAEMARPTKDDSAQGPV